MKQFVILLFISLFLLACETDVQQGPNFADPNPNDTEIQVKNKSWYILDSLYINTSGGDQYYGDLGKRKTSNLKSFRYAYPEMEIRFQVDGKRFIHVPVDYNSMEKVENGRYELELNSIDTNNLSFTFLLEEI